MGEIKEQELYEMTEQLLPTLINLEKLSSHKEGKQTLANLHTALVKSL